MDDRPTLSVLIPTFGRADKLRACLAGLACEVDDSVQVLVGIDGPDGGERAAAREVLSSAQVFEFEHRGPAHVRNRLLEHARGELLLLLNDDVIPQPGLLAAHRAAHDELGGLGRRAMVLGSAPWLVPAQDRLFDRLIRESSMVFFYDRMSSDPWHAYGFRHAWTLNLSVRADAFSAGFDESAAKPCYEDLHWAWQTGLPVFYRPEASVLHDHIYQPAGYLERERTMGGEALRFARRAPAFARDLFGRDIASAEEVAYSAQFVERERALAERLGESFAALAGIESGAIDGPAGAQLLRSLYEHHLPLKRWWWRVGLLEAAGALDEAVLPRLAA